MNRKWMAAAWIVAVAVSLSVGCGPKTPPPVEPPPAPVVEAPPAEPVKPPPAPPTREDPKDIQDLEIAEINETIMRDGLMVDVYFDYDKYELRPDARQNLQKNASFMRENPRLVFALEGHCDERGTNEYNLALGERRANSSRDYLTSLGVGGRSMRTVSYGEERPNCTEHHEGCWRQNRRTHFVVVGKAG